LAFVARPRRRREKEIGCPEFQRHLAIFAIRLAIGELDPFAEDVTVIIECAAAGVPEHDVPLH
jgi:hypothetical protein